MVESKELIEQDNINVAIYGNEGVDDLKKDDIAIPYLNLIQASSTDFKEGRAGLGNFINSITKENFGTELEFVIFKSEPIWKKFINNELVAISKNSEKWESGADEYVNQAITEDDQWKCRYYNFYILIKGISLPYILCLGKTSAKTGKQIMNQLFTVVKVKNQAIYTQLFKLTSKKETNKNKQEYYVFKAEIVNRFPDKKTMDIAKEMREYITNINYSENTSNNKELPF